MTIHDMQDLNRATMEYMDVGAFVFCGDKTAISVSGREYKTDDASIHF